MKTIIINSFLVFGSFISLGQHVMFSPEEKAMLFHVVQKSPVLKRNLDAHFLYKTDTIYFKYWQENRLDSIIDYQAISEELVYEPSGLEVDFRRLSEESTGLLAELSSKMALYKLYKDLKSMLISDSESSVGGSLTMFLDTLTPRLPVEVTRKRNGKDEPIPEIIKSLDPNLFFNQRVKELAAIKSLKTVQQKQVVDAINYATLSYLQFLSKQYFQKLSNRTRGYYSMLIACGDGSNTDGLLGERERIKLHKNKLGDPIGIGLFTYDSEFESTGKDNEQRLTPYTSSQFTSKTIPGAYTNIHFSTWGFNRTEQTTVAVYRGDNMYLLYANKLTKELSPDTTFGKGTTLNSCIERLENGSIPAMNQAINGKEEIREKIDRNDSSQKEVIFAIVETEMALSTLRLDAKKNKKKIKRQQSKLVWLYNRKTLLEERRKTLLKELHIDEARFAQLQARLYELKSYISYNEMKHSHFGFLYTFEDGCTFNTYTQNFVLPDSLSTEELNIRLITFGKDAMSQRVDEIQLLTTISEGKPEDRSSHAYALVLEDVFGSDQYEIPTFNFNPEEHYELAKLLNELLVKRIDLTYNLFGKGVGCIKNGVLMPSLDSELSNYPGATPEEREQVKQSELYAKLRKTSLDFANSNHQLQLTIESFTDPIRSNFSKKRKKIEALKSTFDSVKDNQILSAFRTFFIAEVFTKELITSVAENFTGKSQDKLTNLIKHTLYKSNCHIYNNQYITYKQYAEIAHPEKDLFSMLLEQLKEEKAKAQLLEK